MPDKHRELLSRIVGYLFSPLEQGLLDDDPALSALSVLKWDIHDRIDEGTYDDFGRVLSDWMREMYPPR